MNREIIGVVRLEAKPPYRKVKSKKVWISKGVEYSETYINSISLDSFQRKCFQKEKRKQIIYDARQPVWYVYKDTLDNQSWAYAKFYKMVPLEEWVNYPLYEGIIYDKR